MWHRHIATVLVEWRDQMTEGLVDSRILLKGTCSLDDWRPRPRRFAVRTSYLRLIRIRSLLVISLLSLGCWAAILKAVASMASAVLR